MKLTSLILAALLVGVLAEEIRIPLTPINMPDATDTEATDPKDAAP